MILSRKVNYFGHGIISKAMSDYVTMLDVKASVFGLQQKIDAFWNRICHSCRNSPGGLDGLDGVTIPRLESFLILSDEQPLIFAARRRQSKPFTQISFQWIFLYPATSEMVCFNFLIFLSFRLYF